MSSAKLTNQRDLRDNVPVWQHSPRTRVRSRRHPSADTYDTIIVGAGISGALVAQAIQQPGSSLLIVDRRAPGTGSTAASTAMIQHEVDVPLSRLRGMIGDDAADRAWRRSVQAVLGLEQLVRTLGISCDFRRKRSLYVAGTTLGSRALDAEVTAREDAGIPARFLTHEALRTTYGLDRTAAIVSEFSASANPAQLTAGLLRHVLRRGAELVSCLEITDLRGVGDEVVLATASGHLLVARQVVFCTGYEFLTTLQSAEHQIVSTWALATRERLTVPPWLRDHIVWEASDPYLYLRTDRAGRLIAGGEDEDDPEAFDDDRRLAPKTSAIRHKVESLLGIELGTPAFRWAAAFGTTRTGLPMIGEVPGMKNVYAVMGFGGNGITYSQIAAEIVSTAIAGRADPDADLYRFR